MKVILAVSLCPCRFVTLSNGRIVPSHNLVPFRLISPSSIIHQKANDVGDDINDMVENIKSIRKIEIHELPKGVAKSSDLKGCKDITGLVWSETVNRNDRMLQ